MEKQIGIIDLIIRNIHQYNEQVRDKLKQMAEKKKPVPSNVAA